MLPGVKILAASSPCPALALSLVAAHVLECLLKAYLSRSGSDEALKKKDARHDLEVLWTMAHADGLGVTKAPPDWVVGLAETHRSPYYLRYSTGVHGIVLLGSEPMTSELEALLEVVRSQLS
jgi:hypothetical protein